MAGVFRLYELGKDGVNVDADPLMILDTELRRTQNAIGAASSLQKRPGLAVFNQNLTGGSLLGGIGVPLLDQSPETGTLMIFLGRYPTS